MKQSDLGKSLDPTQHGPRSGSSKTGTTNTLFTAILIITLRNFEQLWGFGYDISPLVSTV
jgi:hypothetical protein